MTTEVQKLIQDYGAENVTTDNLFTAFLGNSDDAKSLCQYQDISKIISKSQKDLELLFSKDTALKLTILKEIMLRLEHNCKNKKLKNINDVTNYLMSLMRYKEQEEFYVISMDTKLNVIKCTKLFIGTTTNTLVDIKIVMREAITNNASRIIVAHNHPSGDPTPSKEDIEITKCLYDASRIMSIELVDHVIVGNNCYYSFFEDDALEETIEKQNTKTIKKTFTITIDDESKNMLLKLSQD